MKSLLTVLFLSIPTLFFAQMQGTIIYKETIKLDIDLPEGVDEAILAMIPKEQSFEHILYFTDKESMYQTYERGEAEEETEHEAGGEDGNVQIKMIIAGNDNKVYRNLATNKVVKKQSFMGKNFLIKEDFESLPWKLTGEQKQIGKYICQQAISQDTTNKVEVWFTPQIPVAVGPNAYAGLPGAVLESISMDGRATLTAIEVKMGEIPADVMIPPTKGKEVTGEEYEKIVEEKVKEMGGDSEGGTTMKIRMN